MDLDVRWDLRGERFGWIALTVIVGVLFRWSTAAGPYSGQGTPPMYGDFEAQRHWMEITFNLPLDQWYANSSDNDLQYWGLDYPPLTAYHSWLLGAAAAGLNASWVALHTSRGVETYAHKLFMRYTVLAADALTLLPAAVAFVLLCQRPAAHVADQCGCLAALLLYPGFILVDYGHFQYNCVSLGLFLWAVVALLAGRDYLASALFVCALSYKQMELYHALPFFCYLFGSCLALLTRSPLRAVNKLAKLSAVVLVSFGIIWWPFLRSVDSAIQVLSRIFPISRGLFEDKVANMWCSLSVLVKWNTLFDNAQLAQISGAACFVLLVPSCNLLLNCPKPRQFLLAQIVSSLLFFLVSFHVHEKTILVVALPVLLMVHEERTVGCWFLLISLVSLHPLCVKDGIQIGFFALSIFYYVFLSHAFDLCRFYGAGGRLRTALLCLHASVCAGLLLCVASAVVTPPPRYPDLFPLLNAVYCCAHFASFLIYYAYKQFVDSFVVSPIKSKVA